MSRQDDLKYPLSDVALARRLERAEARSNADFVDARSRVFAASGACWIEIAGTCAMFDGVQSPLTQTFGLGLFEPAGQEHLEAIEAFYSQHKAPVFHQVSPLAGLDLVHLLNQRGYQPIELTSVMYRPVPDALRLSVPGHTPIQVRRVDEGEDGLWARTAARGWEGSSEFAELMLEVAVVNSVKPRTGSFLAELEGRAIAAAALYVSEGVALLAGASTIPDSRRQGAQRALLEARLHYASQVGCDLSMMCAEPGSASQRNAERHGFRIAYTRIKWWLPTAMESASAG